MKWPGVGQICHGYVDYIFETHSLHFKGQKGQNLMLWQWFKDSPVSVICKQFTCFNFTTVF